MRPGKRRTPALNRALAREINEVGQIEASSRAKAELVFRVVTQQVGSAKVRHRGLAKNAAG